MERAITQNTLFYGDNLDILREYVPDESVDLIYLDPPFNSNRSYNVLFKDESGSEAEAQITAFDDATDKPKRALVQVKSGHVKVGDVRDLRGTVEREKAALGILITLRPPSEAMQKEAVAARFYQSTGRKQDYLRIQILTISDLLMGERVQMPPTGVTFRQAQRVEQKPAAEQGELGLM